jgi:ASTRA-associated protein 1
MRETAQDLPLTICSQGRDNRLAVWKLGAADELTLSTASPLQPQPEGWAQPWLLHILDVNTQNFCSFAPCRLPDYRDVEPAELLIAVPNTLQSEAVRLIDYWTRGTC